MARRGLIVFPNPNARTVLERAYEEYEKALDLKAWQDPRLAALEGVLAKHDQRLKPFAGQSTKAMVIEKRWVDHPAGGGFLWRWSEGFAHDKWHVERLGYARLIVRAAIACIAAPPQGRPGRPSSIPPATPVELTDMGLKRQPILQERSRPKTKKQPDRLRPVIEEYANEDPEKAAFLGPPTNIAVLLRRWALLLPGVFVNEPAKLQAAARLYLNETKKARIDPNKAELAFVILSVADGLGVRPAPNHTRRIEPQRDAEPGGAYLFVRDVRAVLGLPGIEATIWPAEFRIAARQAKGSKTPPTTFRDIDEPRS